MFPRLTKHLVKEVIKTTIACRYRNSYELTSSYSYSNLCFAILNMLTFLDLNNFNLS